MSVDTTCAPPQCLYIYLRCFLHAYVRWMYGNGRCECCLLRVRLLERLAVCYLAQSGFPTLAEAFSSASGVSLAAPTLSCPAGTRLPALARRRSLVSFPLHGYSAGTLRSAKIPHFAAKTRGKRLEEVETRSALVRCSIWNVVRC